MDAAATAALIPYTQDNCSPSPGPVRVEALMSATRLSAPFLLLP